MPGAASLALAAGAGALSTLSPCVLPLLPILVASAQGRHRFGPAALALGLATSFTVMGALVASVGASAGLDPAVWRVAGAVVMLVLGGVLLSEGLQARFASMAGGMGRLGEGLMQRVSGEGWSGQWLLGLTLGLVWSPCVGPTLGSAIALASQGENLGQVALVMAAFGLGAALPMLLLGVLSRELAQRFRGGLARTGRVGRRVLGGLLLLVGLLVLTGLDRRMETTLVEMSPAWLTRLTTSW